MDQRAIYLTSAATTIGFLVACSTNSAQKVETERTVSPAATQVQPLICAPANGALAIPAPADSLAGNFRLMLVATSGQRSGQSANGTLELKRFSGGNVSSSPQHSLFGSASIALDSVGATAPGAIGSADPSGPGVLVIEWSSQNAGVSQREITLRFGALANRGDARPFDGTHMALFVNAMSSNRFTGRWDSGAGTVQVSGYFCAERIGPN